MPPLKRVKHEQFAQIIPTVQSSKEAYLQTFPKSSGINAEQMASKLLRRPEIRERVNELLSKNERTKLPNVLSSLGDDLDAKKEIMYKGCVHELRDNDTRHKTKRLLLDLYGALDNTQSLNTQNNLILVDKSINIDSLTCVLSKLEELAEKMDRDSVEGLDAEEIGGGGGPKGE